MLNNKDTGPVIVCPYCKDSDDFCSSCQGTKEIREYEYIGNLMLQAMLHDSINIRQKILWTFVHSSIKEAINLLKQSMNEDLKKLENEIEEYIDLSKMIKSFNEWSEIFMKEVEFIQVLRNINDKDHDLYGFWRVSGSVEYKRYEG